MFKNDKQRGEVCYLLCAWIPKSPWKATPDGYRPSQLAHAGRLPDGVSTGEAAMIRFSIALWRSEDPVVWLGFDNRRMYDIGELIVAMQSPEMIGAWIAERKTVTMQDRIEALKNDPTTRTARKLAAREAAKAKTEIARYPGRIADPPFTETATGFAPPLPPIECVSCGDTGVDIMADGSSRPCHCRSRTPR